MASNQPPDLDVLVRDYRTRCENVEDDRDAPCPQTFGRGVDNWCPACVDAVVAALRAALDAKGQAEQRADALAAKLAAAEQRLAQIGAELNGARESAAMLGHLKVMAEQERDEARAKHMELLFQVGNKYPGETRHETAKRYIREHEHCGQGGPCRATEDR